MPKIISGIIIEKNHSLTFTELCHAIRVEPTVIVQMVEYQLLEPDGDDPDHWRFDSLSLKRARIAASFYRDLEMNWAGIAMALRDGPHVHGAINILWIRTAFTVEDFAARHLADLQTAAREIVDSLRGPTHSNPAR